MGMNRTGAQMAPLGTKELLAYAEARAANVQPDADDDVALRQAYAHESDGVGSVALPGTMKGMATAVTEKLKGAKPTMFIDKLGERLAYERTGVRLYDALITKCMAAEPEEDTSIDLAQLTGIRRDEHAHFKLLSQTLEGLGADPTAVTPCADVAGVMALGMMQTLTDPRTTVAQALNAMLAVELADNASWELLIELAEETGHDELGAQFESALEAEMRHAALIRGWLRSAVLAEA
jgi:ferritin-like metal-binding protein YciE